VTDNVITFARSAEKELAALPVTVVLRARLAIDALAVGDYRVLYTINDKHRLVDIEAVRHRRFVYR
jgi:hypothetical protein